MNKIFEIARLKITINDENGNKNYPTRTDSQSAVTQQNLEICKLTVSASVGNGGYFQNYFGIYRLDTSHFGAILLSP